MGAPSMAFKEADIHDGSCATAYIHSLTSLCNPNTYAAHDVTAAGHEPHPFTSIP